MPPIRTITTKPIKTERTHEENQERAYIAASRRSDRSLEARVESARRASEIHKRRTGRSLRVTEQDVINEEMYEEEDDDLPLQYRRLTAHLNTNSPDFNRRLAAYLTNHVAMRNALDQAISTSYAQQTTSPMWAQQLQQPIQQQWLGNPMMNQTMMQQPSFQQPMMNMQAPSMNRPSPPSFRNAPYPMPQATTQTYRPNIQRTSSVASQQDVNNYMTSQPTQPQQTQQPSLERRSSVPTPSVFVPTPAPAQDAGLQPSHRSSSSVSLPNLSASTTSSSPVKKSTSVPPMAEMNYDNMQQQAPPSAVAEYAPNRTWSPPQQQSISPLTATLPPDAQMFFPNGYPMAMYQQDQPTLNNEKTQQPFYSYNPNSIKQRSVHPSFDGMNQTLAPGALDNMSDSMSWPTPTSATTDSVTSPFTPVYNYGFDSMHTGDLFQKSSSADPSLFMQTGSGYVTPGEAEWSSFIDPNSWADSTTAA